MSSSTFKDAKFLRLVAASYVCVMANSRDTHGTKDATVAGEKKKVCKAYPTLTCEQHMQIVKDTMRLWGGNIGTPTTILFGPDGKEIDRLAGYADAPTLLKKMEEALKKVPGERLAADVWAAAKKVLADGDEFFAKGEFAKAIKEYQKLSKAAQKALQPLGQAALDKVEEKGKALIAEAASLEKDEKRKALNRIVREFKGLDCEKQAKAELKELDR